MSISITNKNSFFNRNKNVSIILKDVENEGIITTKKENNFLFVFKNNKIIGINVFNFEKYFKIEEGFHLVTNEIMSFFIKNFPNYVEEKDFASFFKIGKIIDIKEHENSNKLLVLNVEFDDGIRQIITNVKTVEKGRKYLFAINGATTFLGSKIVDSKVMNIKSEGMIVSYKSIGINEEGLVNCDHLEINENYKF